MTDGPPATILGKTILVRTAKAFSRIYAMGPKNVDEATVVCCGLADLGIPSTLGKFSQIGDAPADIAQEYASTMSAVEPALPISFYTSLKPPALGFRRDLLYHLASIARASGYGIHFDSHDHDLAQPTLDALDWLMSQPYRSDGPTRSWHFSLTLPTRWKRTANDAQWAIERGCRVRLVKGEFRAASQLDEIEPKNSFLVLTDCLVGRVPEVAFATHDDQLARAAFNRVGSTRASTEIELLWGFPGSRMLAIAHQYDARVRYYVPYGDGLLVYGVRHLIANPHKLRRGNYLASLADNQTRLRRVGPALAQ